jgi:signal transduction histidine kinase
VSDLLKFKSQAEALRRVRVAGVALDSQPDEYILSDNSGSLRVLTKEPQPIQEGDWVEAVGFPQLGGPSPRLLEANIRKVGSSPRPQPVPLSIEQLSDAKHDATLVQLEATLLGDNAQQNKRVLELQAGPNHFLARLRSGAGGIPLTRSGSRLQLTGVYSSARSARPGSNLDAFELLVNRPTDVLVLRSGPWWNPQRVITLIVVLVGGLIVALAWAGLLRRTVARRSAQLQKEIETRQRVEQYRVVEQERSRVAQDLHDELGAGLAELGILGALANNPAIEREKQQGYLTRLAELARLLVTGLDEIVWAVNPKHDSNDSVSGYLCDYAQEFLHPTGIACRLDVVPTLPDHTLNPVQRHQLFLAFKEALTNVVKHAHATEVWVRIGGDDHELRVAVEDNGKGLGLERVKGAQPNQNGLANMVDRMKQIGGDCAIKAQPAGGMSVEFRLFTNRNTTTV